MKKLSRLKLYDRKTGTVSKVLSEEASKIVGDAVGNALKLPEEDQLDVIVAIFTGYVAVKGALCRRS